MHDTEDRRLLRGVRRRDPDTYEQLITRYSRLLWSVAAAILPAAASEELEECVADVFAALWENPHSYDPARGPLRAYLCLLAKSRALDRLRRLRRSQGLELLEELPDGRPSPEELAITKAQAGRALAYFQCQKEPDRRILTLRYLYELMPAAIAEILELTPRQVSNCLYYHRARLLSHLEKG